MLQNYRTPTHHIYGKERAIDDEAERTPTTCPYMLSIILPAVSITPNCNLLDPYVYNLAPFPCSHPSCLYMAMAPYQCSKASGYVQVHSSWSYQEKLSMLFNNLIRCKSSFNK